MLRRTNALSSLRKRRPTSLPIGHCPKVNRQRLRLLTAWMLVSIFTALVLGAFEDNTTFAAGSVAYFPASGSTLDMGNTPIFATKIRSIFIVNGGATSVSLNLDAGAGGLVQTGSEFSLNTALPLTVAAGNSGFIDIACIPTTPGLKMATLYLTSTDPAQPTLNYAFTCNGVSPVFSSNPAPGSLSIGSTSINIKKSVNVVVSNAAGAPNLAISGYSISGPNVPDFSISPASFNVTGGGSQTVQFSCTPTPGASMSRTATIKLNTNDAANPNPTYVVDCTVADPVFNANSASLTFNTTTGTPQDQTTTISNQDSSSASYMNVSGTLSDTTNFSIKSGLPITALNYSGGGLPVVVTCNPATYPAGGVINATLTLTTNEQTGNTHLINLTCNVSGRARYGSVPPPGGTINISGPVGVLSSRTFTANNTAGDPASVLKITAISITNGYTLSGINVNDTLTKGAASETKSGSVNCTPGTTVPTGTLTITTDEPGNPSYSYPLACVPFKPVFSSNPTPGSTITMLGPVGTATDAAPITVSNTGDPGAGLNVSQVSISPGFTVKSGLPISGLMPGAGSASIVVTCTSPTVATQNGTLVVSTNEPGNPTYTFNLKCDGQYPIYSTTPAILPNPLAMTGPTGSSQSVSFNVNNAATAGSPNLTYSLAITAGTGYIITSGFGPFSVAPGGTTSVVITCTPGTSSATGTLSITHNDPSKTSSIDYPLTCNQQFAVYGDNNPANPIVLNSTYGGAPTTANVVITNNGVAGTTLQLVSTSTSTSGPISFTLFTPTVNLGAGQSQNVSVTCGTTSAGTFNGSFTINTNGEATDPNNHTYNVTCNVSAPAFSSNPDPTAGTIDLANTVGTLTSKNVIITNTGGAGSTLDVTFVSNSNPSVFSLTSLPTGLAKNATGQFTVSCTPDGTKPAPTGSIVVSTNEPGSPTYTYNLTCTSYVPQFTASLAAGVTDLGSATVGLSPAASTTPLTVTITNTGDANSSLMPIANTTGASSEIILSGPTYPLAQNQSLTQTLKCTPTAKGLRTINLSYATNEPGGSPVTHSYTINCTGLVPNYTSTPAIGTINFGPVTIPPLSATDTKTIAISNPAAASPNNGILQVSSYSLTGPDNAKFSVTGTAAPFSIQPNGAAQTFSIVCTPAGGGTFTATLTFNSNDPTTPAAAYSLSCVGNAPGFSSTPVPGSTINAGSAAVNSPMAGGSLIINSTGKADLHLTWPNPAITGPNAADFSLSAQPTTLTPTSSATITINCTPKAGGLRSATLTVNSDDPGVPTATYTLNCTGLVPVYASSPAAPNSLIDLGSTSIGSSVSYVLTIQNTGGANLTVNGPTLSGTAASDYTITGATFPFTLAPMGSQNVTITCTPSASNARTAKVAFTSNDASQPNPYYDLTCGGQPGAFTSSPVSPAGTIGMGGAVVGTPLQFTLSIQNKGAGTLIVDKPATGSISGPDAADYSISGANFPLTLAAGSPAVNFTITCTPKGLGQRNATLSFTSTDPANLTPSYTLLCYGQSAGFNSIPVAPGGKIDFGSAAIGTPLNFKLTLQNVGSAALTVSKPGSGFFSGPMGSEFSLAGATFPLQLDAGGYKELTLTCTPGLGVRTANLTFSTTDPGIPAASYNLTCNGLQPGYSSKPVAPNKVIEFEATQPNAERIFNLNVSNTGAGILSVTNGGISGDDAQYFNLVNLKDFPLKLEAGTNGMDIKIRCFSPEKAKVMKAVLTLNTTDPNWPTVKYYLECSIGKPVLNPADLYLNLTANPDRIVSLNPDKLIGFSFKVKNKGDGKSEFMTLRFPLNEALKLAYTQFDNKEAWVREITDTEVVISLPGLFKNEQVTGTIYFRLNLAKAKPGMKLDLRYNVEYIDPLAVWLTRFSNMSMLTLSEGPDMSVDNVVQMLPHTQSGKVGTFMTYNLSFLAPNEFVEAWVTDKNGASFKVDAGWTDNAGKASFSLNTIGMQPGKYSVSIMGRRSEALGNAEMIITAPELTPNDLTLNAGAKVSFVADFMAAGETGTAWLTGADGKSVTLVTTDGRSNDKGRYSVYFDSTNFAPGAYTLSVYGNTSKLQASAKLTIIAPAPKPDANKNQAAPAPASVTPAAQPVAPKAEAPKAEQPAPAAPTQPASAAPPSGDTKQAAPPSNDNNGGGTLTNGTPPTNGNNDKDKGKDKGSTPAPAPTTPAPDQKRARP